MASAPHRVLTNLARFALRPGYRGEVLHGWRRHRKGEPALPVTRPGRILILCHGNICRSPFAEALLRTRLPGGQVRSAGFAAGEGGPADPTAIEVAREWSVDLTPHRAHLLRDADLDWAELVLVMTAGQARDAQERMPAARRGNVRLLGDYLPGSPFAIDDPFGLPRGVFRACFERIDAATERVAALLNGSAR